jgi:dihydrofolate reductase
VAPPTARGLTRRLCDPQQGIHPRLTSTGVLKQEDGGPLLVFGHALFAQALLKARLLDVLDLSVHPFIAGSGDLLFHQDQAAAMKLTATKIFSSIVKLTYEPQYDRS